MTTRLVIGVTGASGSRLALETLRLLAEARVETHLVISQSARLTIVHELGPDGMERLSAAATRSWSHKDLAAPVASGSFRTDGMIVAPCSMRSAAAIAYGVGDNLLTRAADVALKEKRRLVLAPREAPLHEGHLRSLLTLAQMGAVIAPPVPPFYLGLATMDEMVTQVAARLINWAGVDPGPVMTRWEGA